MFDPKQLIRPHIQDLPPYEPILPFEVLSAELSLPIESIVKLDANENPYGPIPEVRQALADLSFPHIYPDPQSRELRAALAEYHHLPIENLLVGAGADELIDLIMRLFLEPGDSLVNCPPTFGMYSFDGDVNQARVINVPRGPGFRIEFESIEKVVHEYKPKLIFLANPNNPDGSLVSPQEVERLLSLPAVLVLDEAYIEFADPQYSFLRQSPQRENLIVLRTFSKWAGLAGLRVGYGAFPTAFMEHLWKIKQPYNVSVSASTAAITSLKYAGKLEAIGKKIIMERERLFEGLQAIEWLDPYPSNANFILCRVSGRPARQVKLALASEGILVRYFNKPGLQDHIRISVGKPEHTDATLSKLREME